MAKIKYATGLTALLKKHFGYVFQPNATNQTMKSDSAGARTRWTRQTQRQQGLMKAIRNWRVMSAETKANWNTFAATYPQASRRNPAIFLSGYQLFLKRNHYCFLNHGIDCDFMEEPSLVEVLGPDITFSITASDNSLDVTELYISNFGILPKVGQFVLIKIYPMSETSGQFFAPIEQTIEVQEVFIDGLFVSFELTGTNKDLTFSVYLSKVFHQSTQYVGTKIRYMGCFTPKTFAALTDTPDDYTGEAGNPIVVNAAGDGLEFGEGGGGGLTCETLVDCPIIIQILEILNSIGEIVSEEFNTSIPPIKYGILYNWYAGTNPLKITSSDDWGLIPSSSHILVKIASYLAPLYSGSMKSAGFDFWDSPNTGATNAAKFNCHAGGQRIGGPNFYYLRRYCSIWTSLDYTSTQSKAMKLTFSAVSITSLTVYKNWGLSLMFCRLATGIADKTIGTYVGNNGRIYRTVVLNGYEYTADAIAETKYRDGSLIPNIEDGTAWGLDTNGAMCYYDNDINNV